MEDSYESPETQTCLPRKHLLCFLKWLCQHSLPPPLPSKRLTKPAFSQPLQCFSPLGPAALRINYPNLQSSGIGWQCWEKTTYSQSLRDPQVHSSKCEDPQPLGKQRPAIFKQLANIQQELTDGSGCCQLILILNTQVIHPSMTVKVVGKGGKNIRKKPSL